MQTVRCVRKSGLLLCSCGSGHRACTAQLQMAASRDKEQPLVLLRSAVNAAV